VVLPQPDGPISAVTRLSAMSRLMSLSACTPRIEVQVTDRRLVAGAKPARRPGGSGARPPADGVFGPLGLIRRTMVGFLLPFDALAKAVADVDGDAVHDQGHHQQHQAGGRGIEMELGLRRDTQLNT